MKFKSKKEWEEIKETHWHENIPEKGVFCEVWDNQTPKSEIALIKKFDPEKEYPYRFSKTYGWKHATPLTPEEVEELIYKPKGD